MNNTNPHDESQVAELLREAATACRPAVELKSAVRQRLMAAARGRADKGLKPQEGGAERGGRWRFLGRSWRPASAAAAMAAAAALIAVLVWPSSVTMAEVQAAVEREPWCHLTFDNGREVWTSLRDNTYAIKWEDGRAVYSDYNRGLRWRFMTDPSNPAYPMHLVEEKIEPRSLQPTIWRATAGHLEDAWLTGQPEDQTPQVELAFENVGGRRLVRFDRYHTDALGQRLLVEQLWADPQTRLPVKVRERLQLAYREQQDREYIEGTYTFPDDGPQSIYDLGVPREYQAVRAVEGEQPADVMRLLEDARAATDRFPEHYRAIVWSSRSSSWVDIMYFSGRPTIRTFRSGQSISDYAGTMVRIERRFPDEGHPLPVPATAEGILSWAATEMPVELHLSDGERAFSQRGPFPPSFVNVPATTVYVLPAQHELNFNRTFWPTEFQWPLAAPFAGASLTVLAGSPHAPPGTVGLRMTTPANQRSDYYLDPAHDCLCLRWMTWQESGGAWRFERDVRLHDLVQLSGGQWVATRMESHEATYSIDIAVLSPEDFPPGLFDVEKALEDARKRGAVIETD